MRQRASTLAAKLASAGQRGLSNWVADQTAYDGGGHQELVPSPIQETGGICTITSVLAKPKGIAPF